MVVDQNKNDEAIGFTFFKYNSSTFYLRLFQGCFDAVWDEVLGNTKLAVIVYVLAFLFQVCYHYQKCWFFSVLNVMHKWPLLLKEWTFKTTGNFYPSADSTSFYVKAMILDYVFCMVVSDFLLVWLLLIFLLTQYLVSKGMFLYTFFLPWRWWFAFDFIF